MRWPRTTVWALCFPNRLGNAYLSEAGNPKTHIVMTTGSADLNEAHRRKFGLIQKLEVEFSRERRELAGAQPAEVTIAKRLAVGGTVKVTS